MTFATELRGKILLPAICAPMFLASSPSLVVAASKAGIIAGLPRGNFRSFEEFGGAIAQMCRELEEHRQAHPQAVLGPIAVNLSTTSNAEELDAHISLCRRHGIELFITATGNPTETIKRIHHFGAKVICDAVSLRFAEKAIGAGADGITAIGAGGGGHSGLVSHLALIPRIRKMFDGVLVMAGCVTDGAAIRAAEILGADLSYLGTRFIATQESGAPQRYKEMLVSEGAGDLIFTPALGGVNCNWLQASLRENGLDPLNLPQPQGKMRYDHLPDHIRPWKTVWSAGQGIELIDDIPSVSDLVVRLRKEYVDACNVRSMESVARLVDQVDRHV
jgi:nitronate monooxygenase